MQSGVLSFDTFSSIRSGHAVRHPTLIAFSNVEIEGPPNDACMNNSLLFEVKLWICTILDALVTVATLTSCAGLLKLTRGIPVLLHLDALMICFSSLQTIILCLSVRARQSLLHDFPNDISVALTLSGHACAVLKSGLILGRYLISPLDAGIMWSPFDIMIGFGSMICHSLSSGQDGVVK